MSGREFKSKLGPTSLLRQWTQQNGLSFFLTTQFKVSTLMISGAILQAILLLIVPARWAMVPTFVLVLNSALSILIQMLTPRNSFIEHVVPGRTTAQLPREVDGNHGGVPADRSLVVFLVGIQFNHPLGFFAPGAQQVVGYFRAIQEDLQQHRDDYGVVSISNNAKSCDRDSQNTLLNIYYFKDLEGLHKFAQGPMHRRAWDWYQPKKYPHIGVYHETFEVQPQSYETVYVNCHPTLLGRGSLKCDTGDDKQFVNTLVSADMSSLKTMYARMGRNEKGFVKEKY